MAQINLTLAGFICDAPFSLPGPETGALTSGPHKQTAKKSICNAPDCLRWTMTVLELFAVICPHSRYAQMTIEDKARSYNSMTRASKYDEIVAYAASHYATQADRKAFVEAVLHWDIVISNRALPIRTSERLVTRAISAGNRN
jgi:hypothetical protein